MKICAGNGSLVKFIEFAINIKTDKSDDIIANIAELGKSIIKYGK